jgi:RHS repeat-associated protein
MGRIFIGRRVSTGGLNDTAGTGGIARAGMDGVTGRNNTFIAGASKPIGVAVDANYVYWTNFNGSKIGRALKAGSGVNQSFIVSGPYPWSVEVRGAFIYWSNYLLGSGVSGDKLGRADVGGTNVNTAFVTGASGPRGIVTDGTYLYWANHTSNTVGRSLLNGTAVSQSFVVSASTATADLLRPAGLAVTGTHVLWSNSDVPKVGRAALTGVVDQITIFLDGQEVVNNPGSANVVSAARYYSGSGLLATRSTVGGLTFVGTDSQGTLTATLTTAGVSTRQRYKPFGEQRGTPLNALPSERGFIGQVEDTAAGLSYLNARHYDAKNATFISVDPVLSIYDPTSLNAYIYGADNPILFSDPTGLEPGGPCTGYTKAQCATSVAVAYNSAKGASGTVFGEKGDQYRAQAKYLEPQLPAQVPGDPFGVLFFVLGFVPGIGDAIDAAGCANGSTSSCLATVIPVVSGPVVKKLGNVVGEEAGSVVRKIFRGSKPDVPVDFIARKGADFHVDSDGFVVTEGKKAAGVSLNTDVKELAKYGREPNEVIRSSVPEGLEIVHTSGTHYEIRVKAGVRMTAEQYQEALCKILCSPKK